jgi:exodeoxyribonuclease VII large subunit
VITSPTAAGYEDFLNQLMHNKGNYPFYVKLFPAIMQGEKTEDSVIMALDRINEYQDYFDVVVIIRGGGASSELNSFDSYLLAANCAQFPLPVITGIGHERDDTIVDMVAHTRMKTPTAVAEFIITWMDQAALELTELQHIVSLLATDILQKQKNHLQLVASRLPGIITNRIERSRTILHTLAGKLPAVASGLFLKHRAMLDVCRTRLVNGSLNVLSEKSKQIQLNEQFVRMVSPDYVLKRGYSLTLKEGKIIKKIEDLSVGEELITRLANGEVSSVITRKEKFPPEIKQDKNNIN